MAAASRNRLHSAVLPALAAMGIGIGLLPNQAQATNTATQQYFDVNSTTAGYGLVNGTTYSWDGLYWTSTSTGLVSTAAYHQDSTYTSTSFPRFNGTNSGDTYTVNVGNTEYFAGMYLDAIQLSTAAFGVTLNINQTPSTTGSLNVPGVAGAPDGVFIRTATDAIVINAPVNGTGGMSQSGKGSLSLYGNNGFSGGFAMTGGQVTNYNNANSFGTGSIASTGTGGQGFVNTAGAAVTIANSLFFTTTNTNFVSGSVSGAAGTVLSGPVSIGTGSVTFQAGNAATDITQFSGNISGAGSINVTGNGSIIFSGPNAYTGQTTVTAGTLKLGATNTISHTASLVMNGGRVDPGGLKQAYGTLKLTANSVLDYISGDAEQDFTGSSGVVWTAAKVLNLANFDDLSPSSTLLRVGTTSGGLLASQLAQIEFNGDTTTLGKAKITSAGYVYLPEPASIAMLLLGAPMLMARRRRA